ncbi:hypothetical protein Tsubulata_046973 [Turnera subulata]|uniref:GATA-type domain-containing protein n=1 Tax=Turnera subulata TaxID=218843 RepID=A0A9Q0F273_9ROSI|nr:hypothetical protein Tsubulata_046973 [Turnera subulata]
MGCVSLKNKKNLVHAMMEVKAKVQKKPLIAKDHGERKKCCSNCKATTTPLWRAGPAGPKSLCNACGIKYQKRRRQYMMELAKDGEKNDGRSNVVNTSSSTNRSTTSGTGNGLKLRLMVLGAKLVFKKSSSSSVEKKKRCGRKRKLGEEEEAAFSLMALSCGSVFA